MNKKSFDIYTDLAIEASEMLLSEEDNSVEGIKVTTEKTEEGDILVTTVEVLDESGSEKLKKPVGSYITIEADTMKENDTIIHEEIIGILSKKIAALKKLKKESSILIIGLGNWKVTPDALGPKVVSKVLVTRHIAGSGCLPFEIDESVRSVAAISPGVMGITGIETLEIVRGITDRVKPDLVIAIDALAARKTSRINATIQMSDTGVNPGAGVGNKRMSLNEETLGVPVIAIGVPTVVDAATLVNDTMDKILAVMINETEKGSEFYKMLTELADDEKYSLITEILDPYSGNMFVTPKEVDAVIDRLSNIIANSINIALHPGIDLDDINRYMYS